MLTHSLAMTRILYLIDNIYSIQFICNYLKNKKNFLNFCLHFLNLDQILNILKKRWWSYLIYFGNYGLPKTWFDKYQNSIASEYPWISNMVNGPKDCWNLNRGIFIIIIDHFLSNGVWKSHSSLSGISQDCLFTQ